MEKKAMINGKIVTFDGVVEGKVLVFDTKIRGVFDEVPAGCEVIDAKGYYVSPGFVDVHIHGSMGADVMDADLASVQTIAKGIAQNGVTSFLPTTLTMDKASVHQSLDNVRHWMKHSTGGATVLGAHLEGPFINEKYKGAQNANFVVPASYTFIEDYTDVIKLLTYAPELDKDHVFTKRVKAETDITLSMGHTDATYDEACMAIQCGCSHVTHLFNAMTPLNHRQPGVVGAALTQDVHVELIADGIHVNPALFPFVHTNKGCDKVILITDSMRAGCMKDGEYTIGGQNAIVKNGEARLADGTLAGSVLKLNDAVKNYVAAGISLSNAIKAATLNPATSIGVAGRKGSLEANKDADIILLDADFNCLLTICEGQVVWNQLDG